MSLSLLVKDLDQFLGDLIDRVPVFGPTEDKNETFSKYRFKKLKSPSDLALGYGPTVIPPKKYLFPARSEILTYEKGQVFPPTNKEFVLFGINKRDGEGLFYLDEVMTKPIPEEDYLKRREIMKLVIIDVLPPSNALNCDLYLQKVDASHYLAISYTEFGEALIRNNKLFGHDKNVGTISTRNLPDEVIYHPRLAEIVAGSRNHPVWDRLAGQCFNCGICSYVCPLCYCFEIDEKVNITTDIKKINGGREKRWDSCMLPEFAAVSFKNFRPEVKDRIYNWYFHKFYRMPNELGFPGCVDCGRCISFCPAKINYREVLEELIADDAKKQSSKKAGKNA